jgi:hypothetical protein
LKGDPDIHQSEEVEGCSLPSEATGVQILGDQIGASADWGFDVEGGSGLFNSSSGACLVSKHANVAECGI